MFMEILKTFENYEKTGDSDIPNKEVLNEKIKIIINGIIKVKQHVKMLRDTTEHVYSMVINKYPKSHSAFIEEIYKRDNMLAELVEMIYDQIENSTAMDEMDEIIGYIDQIQDYTEGDNINLILNQVAEDDDDDYMEEEDEEEDDEDDESNKTEIKKPKNGSRNPFDEVEDQLKRKKPTNNG